MELHEEATTLVFARLETKGRAFAIRQFDEDTYTLESIFSGDPDWVVLYKGELKHMLNQFYSLVGTSLTT